MSEQVRRGILPISSGEFERHAFIGGFFDAIDGMKMTLVDWANWRTDFPVARPSLRESPVGRQVAIATSKVKHSRSAYLEDWEYLRSLLPEGLWPNVKISLPPPAFWHFSVKNGTAYLPGVYGSDQEYLHDVVEALRKEIYILYDAGV